MTMLANTDRPAAMAPVADPSVRHEPMPSAVPAYPASAFRGPLFEARDRVALAMATVMLLGPLAVLPLGLGG